MGAFAAKQASVRRFGVGRGQIGSVRCVARNTVFPAAGRATFAQRRPNDALILLAQFGAPAIG